MWFFRFALARRSEQREQATLAQFRVGSFESEVTIARRVSFLTCVQSLFRSQFARRDRIWLGKRSDVAGDAVETCIGGEFCRAFDRVLLVGSGFVYRIGEQDRKHRLALFCGGVSRAFVWRSYV